MDGEFSEVCFKDMLLDETELNKATVMDNASFYCNNKLYKLYKLSKKANENLKLIFLLLYSLELNPIEKYCR